MKYRIERRDRVTWSAPVREHHVEVRFAPWDDADQRLTHLEIQSEPATLIASHRDGLGNQVHRTALLGAHQAFAMTMRAEVETLLANPFDFSPLPVAREAAWLADALHQAPRLWDFVLHRGPLTPDPATLDLGDHGAARGNPVPALPQRPPGGSPAPLLGSVQEAMARVGDRLRHDPAATPVEHLAELLAAGAGAAVDLSHLLISIVRDWGVPARLVAGYLDPAWVEPDSDDPTGEARPQAVHHWAEVLLPGAGWRGFDPAFQVLADASYIRLAIGRDARDVPAWRQSAKTDGTLVGRTCELVVERLG